MKISSRRMVHTMIPPIIGRRIATKAGSVSIKRLASLGKMSLTLRSPLGIPEVEHRKNMPVNFAQSFTFFLG